MSETIDLISASFAKTEIGQREIQTRSLGLAPLVRRLLVLVDGQKTGKDLAVFAGGTERSRPAESAPAQDAKASSDDGATAGLPDASTRSPSENEMARNFMINTVNTIFGQHSRLSLIETIARAKGTDELRMAYLSWLKAMEEDRIGAKRLPELREKLLKVL